MVDEHAPSLWQKVGELERRTRDLEVAQGKVETRLDEISDQLGTLIKIGVAILGGLLGVAVAIALAVH